MTATRLRHACRNQLGAYVFRRGLGPDVAAASAWHGLSAELRASTVIQLGGDADR